MNPAESLGNARFEFIEDTSVNASLAGRLRRTFTLIWAMVTFAFLATILSFGVSLLWLGPEVEGWRGARGAANELSVALLDEEAGVRGYLLTRDLAFVESFRRAEAAAAQANAHLDAYAAILWDLRMTMARTREAAAQWNDRWATPLLESPAGASSRPAQEGTALFDAYRGEQLAFASALAAQEENSSTRERHVIGLRVALELAIFVCLFILALRQHRALHNAIVVPVAALLRDIGRVRDGELVMTIVASAPSELRQLAAGLNDMVGALALAKGIAESRDILVREHSDRLRLILDASREFSESLNLAYVVRSVRTSTMALGNYDRVIVWLTNTDQGGLRDAEAAEFALIPEPSADHSVAWRAAKSGRIAFEGSDGRVRFGDAGPQLVLARAIPLIVGARVVGALEARNAAARVTTHAEGEVLEMLAVHAATAIESARLNQVAEERSQMDPLTRLNNRRRLEEDLDSECKRSGRYGRPLSFVMLDVDHFKIFNDTHGHPQADVALQAVADVIGGAVRTTDSAYRYGGEEFCVLLRETTAENAMHFAERLRERIELRFASGETPGITASFGVADLSPDVSTPRALVEAADAAMYEAKRAGRNRVSLSSHPAGAILSVAPPANVGSLAEPAHVSSSFMAQHGDTPTRA